MNTVYWILELAFIGLGGFTLGGWLAGFADRRPPVDAETGEGIVRRVRERRVARDFSQDGVSVIESTSAHQTVSVRSDGAVTTLRVGPQAVLVLASEEAKQERERALLARAVVDELERRGAPYR